MHDYATDSRERRQIVFGLMILSIVTTIAVRHFVDKLCIVIPFPLEAPSVALFFAIFYTTFNRCVWKTLLLRKLGIIKVPNLAGNWSGELRSSYDKMKNAIPITLSIQQTWTSMSVKLKAPKSNSFSRSASILIDVPDGPCLIFYYQNEPLQDAVGTMVIHKGANILKLVSEDVIEGEYFTGRGRMTFGCVNLNRISTQTSN